MPATQIQKETALANAINAYIVDMAEEWQTPIRNTLEIENMIDSVYCLETYAEPSVAFSGLIQAYQGGFTPTGQVAVGAHENKLQAMKTDLKFDEEQLEKFANSQFPLYHPAGDATLEDNQFIQRLLNQEFFEGWKDEMNLVSIKGQRVAPTPGTAGTVLGAVDGFERIFADLQTAGKLNTILTGAITEEDIYDQIQMALDAIPKIISRQGGMIYLSPTQTVWYSRAYKKAHPHAISVTNNADGPILTIDEYPKFMIKTLTEREGANDIWIDIKYRGKTNMITLKHKVKSDMPTLTAYPRPRGLDITSSWHRGYGIRRYELTYKTRTA